MGGKMTAKDKIKEGILLLKQENNELSDKVTAILYTLADKFLTGEELNEGGGNNDKTRTDDYG